MLRGVANQAVSQEYDVVSQLRTLAAQLDVAHREAERREELANAGTVACEMCDGLRVWFDSREHVQCPRCRGWGREIG